MAVSTSAALVASSARSAFAVTAAAASALANAARRDELDRGDVCKAVLAAATASRRVL